MDYLLIIYDKLIVWILVNSTIQVQIPSIKLRRPPEMRIYKRKQESKKTRKKEKRTQPRKRPRKKELDQESDQVKKNSTKKAIPIILSCFLGRFPLFPFLLGRFLGRVLFSFFLVFFYKFSPLLSKTRVSHCCPAYE